jgi:hypothetical protein
MDAVEKSRIRMICLSEAIKVKTALSNEVRGVLDIAREFEKYIFGN